MLDFDLYTPVISIVILWPLWGIVMPMLRITSSRACYYNSDLLCSRQGPTLTHPCSRALSRAGG